MDDLSRMLGFDLETLSRQTERMFGGIKEYQEAGAALVGRAKSADGQVKVEWTEQEGVRRLEIDPRAMREGSERLGEIIATVIGQARADLRKQDQEALEEALGADGVVPDTETMVKNADRAAFALHTTVEATMEYADRIRAMMRRNGA